jgi:type I restriction enzyme M protein
MNTQSSTIVQRVWNYRNVLRDDGISYGDYVEQLTYLIFLKMDEENTLLGNPSAIPEDLRWRTLFKKEGEILDGEALEAHYIQCLTTLGKNLA